ncbi:helix-turn-helix domain-containing protein [Pseudoalteromonas obscura]|uniref:Helix-turn-helix transcriptional regulator n=1 Tax=Pseudoalteromonas obscura TaxID=3048491 RepID=A0ABT7EL46_9GAMM|nr:helix-turn-helix transcriptional regulator [Pseudoalteromonas sp. P94(2023)]MDK2595777.1 helix-turn-helix transcriptional regulator [Pseudoalteromonas sp. P94(2023)]
MDGRVKLDCKMLKQLRRDMGLSQEKLACACQEKALCVSIATLKRAECGCKVYHRTARELARFYQIPVKDLLSDQPI